MSALGPSHKPISRREFIKLSEAISMGLFPSACGVDSTPTTPLRIKLRCCLLRWALPLLVVLGNDPK